VSVETAVETNADLPEHRVAVVVFTTVRAVDALDALNIAESAVRKAIRDARGEFHSGHKLIYLEKITKTVRWLVPVTVHSVLEVSRAARNGHLGVSATPTAYRESAR
jgi:hypothetical protein